eukprot:5653665-Alexandrium_andersonii.AAC.1
MGPAQAATQLLDRPLGRPLTVVTQPRQPDLEDARSEDRCPSRRCCGPLASASPASSARSAGGVGRPSRCRSSSAPRR